VANGNDMELTWWTLAVERPVPGPNRYSFTATGTNSAKLGTVNQAIALAAGQTLTVGTCGVYGASFHGDTYLRLFNAAGVQVAKNDDACGTGSRITYTAPTSQTIEVRAGCFVNTSCDGQVAWIVY
jgi:hypothetical protein